MDAFDADVLIYAAAGNPAGDTALAALRGPSQAIGSVLLLPEVLIKPLRMEGTRGKR